MRHWMVRIGLIGAALLPLSSSGPALAQDAVPQSAQQIELSFSPVDRKSVV